MRRDGDHFISVDARTYATLQERAKRDGVSIASLAEKIVAASLDEVPCTPVEARAEEWLRHA